jgi:H+/gluconate symporter-like permease
MAPIIVFLQETDLSAFDPEYASELLQIMEIDFMLTPTGSVTAATASPTSGVTATTPASTSSPGPTNTPTTSGLSTGAKADIGIGAAVGVMLVCIASFLLYKKMFQRKAKLDRDSSLQNQQPELVQARIPEATA